MIVRPPSHDCRNKGPTENVLLAAGILKIFALRTFEFTYFWITRLDFGQARKAVTRQLLFGSTQVRSTFQIINILASQTLLLSLLFVRAIRFSTDFFLPDVTPPHLERWEFAIIRIRDAPSHVIFPGPPENSGTKGGGHEGQV